ncbi:MAG: hypothetical protein ACLUKN_03085 [Bacilli bacterium]
MKTPQEWNWPLHIFAGTAQKNIFGAQTTFEIDDFNQAFGAILNCAQALKTSGASEAL